MIEKLKTAIQVVKSIPVMVRCLWWWYSNQDEFNEVQDQIAEIPHCEECDVSSRNDFRGLDQLCEEHREVVESVPVPF